MNALPGDIESILLIWIGFFISSLLLARFVFIYIKKKFVNWIDISLITSIKIIYCFLIYNRYLFYKSYDKPYFWNNLNLLLIPAGVTALIFLSLRTIYKRGKTPSSADLLFSAVPLFMFKLWWILPGIKIFRQ